MTAPVSGPPTIWHGLRTPGPDIMRWVQRVAQDHYANGGSDDDAELSTNHFPICASLGPVRAHVDEFDGAELGKRIYGLVLRSDGHVLHTDSHPEGISLAKGDLYGLDPHDRHWTTCPGDGELIFVATFLPLDDPRCGKPNKLAHDLTWETIAAHVNALRAEARELAIDKAAMRGVGDND